MFPPPVVAVIVCGEDELMGSESLTLPPAEVAFTSYWVVPRGTMIVMLPPSLVMRTLPGTVANSIWTFPPPVPAVTWAVVSAVPLMSPPSVVRVRLPAVVIGGHVAAARLTA